MDDLISRKAAIEAIEEDKIDLTNPNIVSIFKATGDFEKAETQVMTCDRHIKILKDLPPAQPERKKGWWKQISPAGIYECSVCGQNVMTGDIEVYSYCHGCGAKMEVSE